MYSLTYRLLAAEFAGPTFEKLSRLFFDTSMQTCIGQLMDTTSEGKLEHTTPERYDAICRYKTTYYTIYTPLAVGIILSLLPEGEERRLLENAKQVSVHVGQVFQEQDDYLDVFGDPTVMGKQGTDIVDGKVTWMAAYALAHTDAALVHEFQSLYGTEGGVGHVGEVLSGMGIHSEYERRQREASHNAMELVDPRLGSATNAILAELMHRKA